MSTSSTFRTTVTPGRVTYRWSPMTAPSAMPLVTTLRMGKFFAGDHGHLRIGKTPGQPGCPTDAVGGCLTGADTPAGQRP